MPQSLDPRVKDRFQEIFSLPPNDLGDRRITFLYKTFTGPLKSMTFFYILPLSFVIAIVLYVLLGQLVVKLVSLLQYGF
jgi:hypothetical protein